MGIFRRVSDIVSANLNEMVEKFESPETMLRQAIREMDAAVARTMEAAARVIADERLLESQLLRHREESAGLYRRARESLLGGNEAGARRALSRRNECEKLIAALGDQLAAAHATGAKIRRRLDAMRVRRTEAERSLHVLAARLRSTEAQRQWLSQQFEFGIHDAGFARFERMRRRIERTEAEADTLLELAGRETPDDAEMPGDHEIEAQLRTLRQECDPSATR
ncbi:MAG: PspA/IM30 family protein [Deltaproteobacteria bacterium]